MLTSLITQSAAHLGSVTSAAEATRDSRPTGTGIAGSRAQPVAECRRRLAGAYTGLVNIFTSDVDREAHARARGVALITILSVLETLTFALLVVVMAANSASGVSGVWLVQGLLFAAYTLAVLSWRAELQWSPRFTAAAIFTGPVGPVPALERLRRLRFGSRVPRR